MFHKCDHCEYESNQKFNLRRHEKSKHGSHHPRNNESIKVWNGVMPMDRFRVLVHDYSGSEDSETLFEICDLYSDSDQSEIDTKNDDEIIEDMEQAAVDMKRDVEFDKTDEDKESDKWDYLYLCT